MDYYIKQKCRYNKGTSGLLETLLFLRGRSKRGRAALHDKAVASLLPQSVARLARPAAFLHLTAICFFGLFSVGSLALAQDSADPVPEQSAAKVLATRVEADDQAGIVRIIIDGEERAVFDADGLHVKGSIDYTGTLTDVSDLRLKTDVRPLSIQSEGIGALKPVTFGMADDPAHRTEYGLIAQEVEAVYPALVETRAGSVKVVNYTGLIAPLIAAVQDLQADNSRLRARIEALEAASGQAPPEAEAP